MRSPDHDARTAPARRDADDASQRAAPAAAATDRVAAVWTGEATDAHREQQRHERETTDAVVASGFSWRISGPPMTGERW